MGTSWADSRSALAQCVTSWSCITGARVLGRNVEVLLGLAERILNEFLSLCELHGHAQCGYTPRTMNGGAGSSAFLYSQHEFCLLAAPDTAGCRAHILALCIGSILQAKHCFCMRTNGRQLLLQCRRQAGYKMTCTSLKGQEIPSSLPHLCLSPQEARLLGSCDQTMLSTISLGSNLCSWYQPPGSSMLGDDSPWVAAL